jgi:hypothetical protein
MFNRFPTITGAGDSLAGAIYLTDKRIVPASGRVMRRH